MTYSPNHADSVDYSTPAGRRAWITDTLFERGEIHIEEIARELHISTATAYRDAQKLEREGILARSKGFLRAIAPSTAELPASVRAKRQLEEKSALAKEAIGFVAPGDVIILDDSSTNAPLLPLLQRISSLTIITNSLDVAFRFRNSRSHNLILIGGHYQSWAGSFYGTVANEMLANFRADFCFMSDAAVWGDSTYNPNDYVISMKQTILKSSERKILMIDHTKFSRAAWQKTSSLSAFSTIITTRTATSKDIENLRKYCDDVRVV
ncbi:MAG: DeoR/GlpR family DNA-binding transcription regulator [Actinomycetaceae bacterium]|nr:DeoR/GlpR family DNA-binding transcription regulator [Actinomycetaceae bacterium]